MYIAYESTNEINGYIELKDDEVVAILNFIDENELIYNGECFSYSMGYEEACSILDSLEEEAEILVKTEKEFEYEAVLSKETFDYTTTILELVERFSRLVNEKISFATIYISIENLAVEPALQLKRKEATEQQRLVSEVTDKSYYHHSIDLPFSVEKDYFDKIRFQPGWGIAYLQAQEKHLNKYYIPLKGYEVSVETTVKTYFTGACEVTYSAYHIYRNQKDHRYSYKVKRAQRIVPFLINEGIVEYVNLKNEEEYFKRVQRANELLEASCQQAEKSVERLYKLNEAIVKPFLKNQIYYERMTKQVEKFLERDYAEILETYFLLGIITSDEYTFHQHLQDRLRKMILEIEVLKHLNDKDRLITKQALLLRYFLANTEIAPIAGVIRDNNCLQRSLMQIEQERCYSEEFRSDDSIKDYYKELTPKKI